MTNFEPLKKLVWESARAGNKEEFDKNCSALMEKTISDIWRMGWMIAPKDLNEVYKLLDDLTQYCHSRWIAAMESGDAPPEDVSPGEGFAHIKEIIQKAVEGNEN